MSLSRFASVVALLVSLLGAAAPPPAQSADAFYLRLLERGVQDLEFGLVDQAIQKLRVANFGFLDEPELLAEGLVHLGRAQAQKGDTSDLTDTVMRLVEIEDRFGAYTAVDVTLKAKFEGQLRDSLPETLLGRLTLFEHLAVAPETAASSPESLTLKQRTKALESELAANPDDVGAVLALSRLYHEGGKLKPASRLLDRLLTTEAQNQEALCLRANIAIERKECAPALAGLGRCLPLTTTDREDAFVLGCLVSARRSEEAAAFVEQLPEQRRQAPSVVRAARKLAKAETPIGAETLESSVESPPPAPEPVAESAPLEAPDPRRPELRENQRPESLELSERPATPALAERIQALRDDVRRSEFREQLEEALQRAMTLANDNPNSTEAQYLAAEIAYLAAEWQLTLDYFDRASRPGSDRPELLFYLAVAHYELGNTLEAAAILRPALPQLSRSSFVDDYVSRILKTPPS